MAVTREQLGSAWVGVLSLPAGEQPEKTSSWVGRGMGISVVVRSSKGSAHGAGRDRDGLLSVGSSHHGRRGRHRSFYHAVPKTCLQADGARAWRDQSRWDPGRFVCAFEASSKQGSRKSCHWSARRRAAQARRIDELGDDGSTCLMKLRDKLDNRVRAEMREHAVGMRLVMAVGSVDKAKRKQTAKTQTSGWRREGGKKLPID